MISYSAGRQVEATDPPVRVACPIGMQTRPPGHLGMGFQESHKQKTAVFVQLIEGVTAVGYLAGGTGYDKIGHVGKIIEAQL